MDWQIIHEIRLFLEELPNARFWVVWFLLMILIIGFCPSGTRRGNKQSATGTRRTPLIQSRPIAQV